jgi:hypothetical protein
MPLTDDADFQEWRRKRYEDQPKPLPKPLFDTGDLLLSVPRGIEAAAQDVYGLADTLAFDALPDYDQRFLGESKTVVGGLAEGIVNFAAGFIPVAGVVGKLGKGLKLATEAGKLTTAGFAVTGAITDLAVFGGREQRLSNLIQEFPALQNPVTEYLAADKNDSELEGRIKNVLEGVALGGMGDVLVRSLRALKGQRKAIAAGTEVTLEDTEGIAEVLTPRDRTKDAAKIIKRLELDANFGKYSDPKDVETIRDFIHKVGPQFFDGVKLKTTNRRSASNYDFTNGVVTLGRRAMLAGELDSTVLHELWHHLSQYVDEDIARSIDKQFKAEKAAALRKDPTLADRLKGKRARQATVEIKNPLDALTEPTPAFVGLKDEEYRFLDVDEWFAETLTDRSFAKLDAIDEAMRPGVKGLIAHGKLWLKEVFNGIRAKFGGSKVDKLLDDFFGGRIKPEMKQTFGIADSAERERFLDPDPAPAPKTVEGNLSFVIGETKAKEIAQSVTSLKNLDERLEKTDLNLSRWAATDEGKALPRTMENLYRSTFDEGRPVTWTAQDQKVTEQLATILDVDPALLRAKWETQLTRDGGDLRDVIARVHGHSRLLLTLSQEIGTLAKKVATGGTDQDVATFARNLEFYGKTLGQVKSLRAEVGRGLGFMRRDLVPIEALEGNLDLVKMAQDAHGGREAIIKRAQQIVTAYGDGGVGGARAVAKLAEYSARRRGLNMGIEYWMNSILSGPKTLAVNMMSGAITSVYLPLEKVLGSMAAGILNPNSRTFASEAFRELALLTDSWSEAARIAYRAGMEGQGVLTSRMAVDLPQHDLRAITAANAGLNPSTMVGKAVDWLGSVIRIPTGLMAGSDEFIKQINYRAVVKTDLLKEGAAQGLSGESLGRYVEENLDKLIFNGQAFGHEQLFSRGLTQAKAQGLEGEASRDFAVRFANDTLASPEGKRLSALSQRAINRAEDATYTNPLHPESVSAKVNNLVTRHPLLRFVAPFIRTPANIAKFAGQRLDTVGFARGLAGQKFPKYAEALTNSRNRMVQDLLSKDPRRVAAAYGRMSAGVGFTAVGLTMAQQGTITGRGPSDDDQRKALESSGWQPYSVKVGDRYISYARVEPFATVIGIWADVNDYFKRADPDQDATLVYALGTALANNITNKTYLTGISHFIDAVRYPDRRFERWVQRYAASAVPNVLGQAVGAVDPSMREVRSILDAVMSKIPGLSATLPVQRNMLGEPSRRITSYGDELGSWVNWWSPLAYSDVKDDVVAKELASLGHGWTPPKTTQGGLELIDFKNSKGQDAYDRWAELQGSTKIGGRNLRQALRALVESQRYQAMSPVNTPERDTPRIAEVQKVLGRYRRVAFRQMKQEYPELVAAEKRLTQEKLAAKYSLRLLER